MTASIIATIIVIAFGVVTAVAVVAACYVASVVVRVMFQRRK